MDKLRRQAVKRLTVVADEDLRVAAMCLHAQPPALLMAVFHAQQAAEKYLKAWLVALGEDDPPVTHNLLQLADMVRPVAGRLCRARPFASLFVSPSGHATVSAGLRRRAQTAPLRTQRTSCRQRGGIGALDART